MPYKDLVLLAENPFAVAMGLATANARRCDGNCEIRVIEINGML